MALQTTGAISLSDIQTEFGGTNPISMSEYYRGGGLVSSNNASIPESGLIKTSQFYGASAYATMYEQVLTGSGTFTPLYAGAMAIIQIGGGGGGGGYAGWDSDVQDYSQYGYGGRAGTTAAGDSIFVTNIDDFSGGSYSVGAGGAGKFVTYGTTAWGYGNYGNASYFNSPANSPYYITAGRGGRGGYQSTSYPSAPADPMSGVYPTGTTGLPAEVLFNGSPVSTSTYMGVSSGGAGGAGGTSYYPSSVSSSAGGDGFIRIYYIVG